MTMPTTLTELLEAAAEASPLSRIDYRDRIAGHGVPAVEAIAPWLSDPHLGAFAVRVITRAGLAGPRKEAAAALTAAKPAVPPVIAKDIDEALATLGVRAAPTTEPKPKPPVQLSRNLRARLVDVARAGRTMTYTDAAEILGLSMRNPHHRRLLGQHLGAISEFEVDHGRPMLSVVVVHKGEKHVGTGFLQLGEELGRKRAVEDDQSFEVRELFRVHDYWRSHADDEPAQRQAPNAETFVRSLVGTTITTLTGRPNRVLAVADGKVLVGTDRSPGGELVPISDIQAAVDALYAEGSLAIDVETVGYRSAFVGAVLSALPGARATASPQRIVLE